MLYVFNMIFTSISLVLSAVVLNICQWRKEPPGFVKKVRISQNRFLLL